MLRAIIQIRIEVLVHRFPVIIRPCILEYFPRIHAVEASIGHSFH